MAQARVGMSPVRNPWNGQREIQRDDFATLSGQR